MFSTINGVPLHTSVTEILLKTDVLVQFKTNHHSSCRGHLRVFLRLYKNTRSVAAFQEQCQLKAGVWSLIPNHKICCRQIGTIIGKLYAEN